MQNATYILRKGKVKTIAVAHRLDWVPRKAST